jgi:hypothetical protein
MAETKYGKYIVRGTKEKVPTDKPGVRTRTLEKEEYGVKPGLNWRYVSAPAVVIDEAHYHDFDEFLVFTGADPSNPDEFAAEVEISMGTEGEKNIVNTPGIVVLPKGTVHGPIKFTKVEKPAIFCNIYLSEKYVRQYKK